MPFRPEYRICPGDRLEVEVVQPTAVAPWSWGSSTRCRRWPNIHQRHGLARRVHSQMAKIDGRSLPDFRRIADLERRYSHLRGCNDPKQVEVDPSSAAGLSAAEIVMRVREQLG